ncbi:MAG: ZIP family metal transporter, partial [Methylicorpusculum sp.]|nr:ZIP family metal transporter [Methylicorpusculum sp.]
MTTPPIATKIQQFYGSQVQKAQQSEYYKKLMDMPTPKRWMTLAGVFAASQVIVFGGLYLIFGKIVVIGFLASILAGLATGVGAIPALFFTNISRNLFNSMLGAAAGVMLAATAFSLLVPGIAYGNEIWPGNGLWVVALGM